MTNPFDPTNPGDSPADDSPAHDFPADDFRTDDFTEVEARLAAYGEVLRDELAKTPAAVVGDRPTNVVPIGVATPGTSRSPRRRHVVTQVAAVLLLLVGAIGWVTLRSDSGTSVATTTETEASVVTDTTAGELKPDDPVADLTAPQPEVGNPEPAKETGLTQEDSGKPLGVASDSADSAEAESAPSEDVDTATFPPSPPTAEQPALQSDCGDDPSAETRLSDDGRCLVLKCSGTDSLEQCVWVHPAASNQLSCSTGELVGTTCVITAPAVESLNCPDGEGVFAEFGECWHLVPNPDPTCLDPGDDGSCLREIPRLGNGTGECPADTVKISDAACQRSDDPIYSCDEGAPGGDDARTCPESLGPLVQASCGDLQLGTDPDTCISSQDTTTELTCTGQWPEAEVEADGRCFDVVNPTSPLTCTNDGELIAYDADAAEQGWICLIHEPSATLTVPVTCPTDWFLIPNALFTPNSYARECGQTRPVTTTCPATFEATAKGQCQRFSEPEEITVCTSTNIAVASIEECGTVTPATCPADHTVVAAGCRKPIPAYPAYESCAEGELVQLDDDYGHCVTIVPLVSAGPLDGECPASGSAGTFGTLEIDGTCYERRESPCASPKPDNKCLVSLPDSQSNWACPPDYALTETDAGVDSRPTCQKVIPAS